MKENRQQRVREELVQNIRSESWGVWSDTTLKKYGRMVSDVPGDLAELGVAKGRAFIRLAILAKQQGKGLHGFDSFRGMAKPGKYDREQGHPEGQFDVGGVDAFRELPWIKDLAAGSFHLWEGYVPECFDKYTGPDQFSLVIIDFDHYEPTREGLRWAWPRLSPGGIALLDDVDFGWEQESTRAVNEFLRENNQFSILDHYNHQLIIKKTARSP